VNSSPFLYQGPQTPGRLPAVARVLTVERGGEAVAYPYAVLQKVVRKLSQDIAARFTFYQFDVSLHPLVRSTNLLERV
jgi:hypothetical protein